MSHPFFIGPLAASREKSIRQCTPDLDHSPVPLSRLRSVHFVHSTFSGEEAKGEMIVLDALAESVLEIFKELYTLNFPLHLCHPSDEFAGDDVACMEVNNSSAYNCRRIMNSDRWSSHAYGAAIDINPIQNPYVILDQGHATANIYPSGGTQYLNRHLQEPGMVEPIVAILAKHGFTEWGGMWRSPLDYHHFQVPWEKIPELI